MTRKRLKKLLMGKGFKRNLAEWVSTAGPRTAPSVEAYWNRNNRARNRPSGPSGFQILMEKKYGTR